MARTEGTQAALERFMKRQYSRKKLGRKLTEEEKEQRKKNQMHVPNWEVDIFLKIPYTYDKNLCMFITNRKEMLN